MKKFKVTAYNGIGPNKVLAGERMVDQPETVAEAIELEKTQGEEKPEDSVLEYYWSSKVIEIQRQIRAGTTMSAKAQLAKLLEFAKANPESDVAKTLALLEITPKAPVETPPQENGNGEGEAETSPQSGSEEKPQESAAKKQTVIRRRK